MEVKTSDTNAIYVDWLQRDWPGKVGLTFAPGKHAYGKIESVRWERDLAKDLDQLREGERVDVLVCLLRDEELLTLQIPGLVQEAERRGMIVLRLPIRDGGVLPSHEPVQKLVAQISAFAHEGKRVVVHCAGGLGRAGTIAGCFLVGEGVAPAAAIEFLHKTRSINCPETPEQEAFIHQFHPAETQA